MGVPQQEREGLVGGPGVSYGLCWLRTSLELGRSRRAAARLPFWVKAGRVSTDTDRLFNGDTDAAGLMRVVSSSRTLPLSGLSAPQKKVWKYSRLLKRRRPLSGEGAECLLGRVLTIQLLRNVEHSTKGRTGTAT
ncbi:hypothetical protein NDU88_001140 [Pleurodeles waltl]|uniref:Uncharacterized protein n=1 Tax=Pleurodeles waltl TaxID=8319 RepID=A0AAV7V7M6_PLEWA|nr:hypothetical protein NDU88_001140 [Pleurodeles waltl]